MTNYIRKLLTACEDKGYSFICAYDDTVDYKGTHAAEAEEALMACDEMNLRIMDGETQIANILIVNENDGAEVFSDWSGEFMDKWWKENCE